MEMHGVKVLAARGPTPTIGSMQEGLSDLHLRVFETGAFSKS